MTTGVSQVMIRAIRVKPTSFGGLDARCVVSRRPASIAGSDQFCAGTNTFSLFRPAAVADPDLPVTKIRSGRSWPAMENENSPFDSLCD
jgi:hypothetical protein